MAKEVVYAINDFGRQSDSEFYANRLTLHVKQHHFTNLPHKHDFYLTIIVTKGSGHHEIDFVNYPVEPGSVFMMQPGQMHWWRLSDDVDGFVFFHSREFFEEGFVYPGIHRFNFFKSFQSSPYAKIEKKQIARLEPSLLEILKECASQKQFKFEKLRSLVNIIYIDIARVYEQKERSQSYRYHEVFSKFERLIEQNYRLHRLPNYYASKLSISEKHLNRICRECVDKTSTELIAERVLLEAKRLLIQTNRNVTEIGDELGYRDTSYFVRFFKKHDGRTPLLFRKKYFDSE